MTEKLRAAAYVRVSTDRQAKEGLSLAEQRRRVEAHIAAHGWTLAETFVEAGVSGRTDDRPELTRLMAAVEARALDVVVIPKLDRFGRSVRQLHENFDRLDRAGVALVSLSESIDTSTSVGRLLRAVLAALAEFESDTIGDRVASVTAARAAQGKAHGRAPFGYRQAGSKGLVVNEAEAAIVRRIFREYAIDGLSQRSITRGLNTDGISAQRGQWTQGTVSKLLANEVYVGKVRLKGETYDGLHDPIVDTETWRKSEQLRAATARTRRGRTPTANHVLAGGLLRCGRCGSAMGATTKPTRTPGSLYEVYACSGRAKHGLAFCDQPPVQRRPIDEAIWRFFTEVALDVEATRVALTEASDAKLAELAALRHQAEQEAQRAQDRLTRVRRDYQDGALSAADWTDMRAELTGELEAADAQVERLDRQRLSIAAEAEQIDTESAVLEELTALRAMVVGEARDAEGLDAFRTALRRLFAGFELLAPFDFGQGPVPNTLVWPHPTLSLGGMLLLPQIRDDAIESFGEQFPALRRASLGVRRSDANTLQM